MCGGCLFPFPYTHQTKTLMGFFQEFEKKKRFLLFPSILLHFLQHHLCNLKAIRNFLNSIISTNIYYTFYWKGLCKTLNLKIIFFLNWYAIVVRSLQKHKWHDNNGASSKLQKEFYIISYSSDPELTRKEFVIRYLRKNVIPFIRTLVEYDQQ